MSTLGDYSFDIIDGLPVTLQSLLMVWFALIFGMRVGLTAVLLYLLSGGLGLGVFSGGASGWAHFSGSTGGFLLAFPIGALIAGKASDWLKSRENPQKYIFFSSALILLLSQTTILLMGLYWLNSVSQDPLSLDKAIQIFGPGLLVKTAIGTMAYVVALRIFYRHYKQLS
jgi:biotin transport system substrate-specific component